MTSKELLEHVLEAHGGRQRWQSLECIEADFSSAGLAFSLHMQPRTLRNLKIRVQPHARRVELRDFVHPGWCGVWMPNRVRILNDAGDVMAQRQNPRAAFSRIDKQVRWDKLDILYFAGYALWNYLSFPFILETPGVTLGETGCRTLQARFDSSVPSHSEMQTFHIDDSGLLTRHDYTADVIGKWANAANFCLESEVVDGVRFYVRRRVFPRLGANTVLPLPTLVWIEIEAIRLLHADEPSSGRQIDDPIRPGA